MDSFKTNARLAGILFLLAMVASLAGGGMIETLVHAETALADAAENAASLSWAVALEYLNGIAVIGIGALLYPVMKPHTPTLAVGYVGMRITEAVFYLIGATIPLVLLTLAMGGPVLDTQTLAPFLVIRSLMMELAVPVFLGLGGMLLYSSMYQSRLLPRFLTVWGFFGAIAMMVANIWTWGMAVQIVLVLPILLNESVLGIWLIVRGFNQV